VDEEPARELRVVERRPGHARTIPCGGATTAADARPPTAHRALKE